MPRKPIKPDDAEQSKRFIEAAEEVDAGDDKALERVFMRIARAKPRSRHQSNKSDPAKSKE
ncbi:MAG: hypothetical protein WB689_08395 [Xanthobacteraceae bacterium]|jgi:hypothetical protein